MVSGYDAKNLLKSANIWQSYSKNKWRSFFDSQCTSTMAVSPQCFDAVGYMKGIQSVTTDISVPFISKGFFVNDWRQKLIEVTVWTRFTHGMIIKPACPCAVASTFIRLARAAVDKQQSLHAEAGVVRPSPVAHRRQEMPQGVRHRKPSHVVYAV